MTRVEHHRDHEDRAERIFRPRHGQPHELPRDGERLGAEIAPREALGERVRVGQLPIAPQAGPNGFWPYRATSAICGRSKWNASI